MPCAGASGGLVAASRQSPRVVPEAHLRVGPPGWRAAWIARFSALREEEEEERRRRWGGGAPAPDRRPRGGRRPGPAGSSRAGPRASVGAVRDRGRARRAAAEPEPGCLPTADPGPADAARRGRAAPGRGRRGRPGRRGGRERRRRRRHRARGADATAAASPGVPRNDERRAVGPIHSERSEPTDRQRTPACAKNVVRRTRPSRLVPWEKLRRPFAENVSRTRRRARDLARHFASRAGASSSGPRLASRAMSPSSSPPRAIAVVSDDDDDESIPEEYLDASFEEDASADGDGDGRGDPDATTPRAPPVATPDDDILDPLDPARDPEATPRAVPETLVPSARTSPDPDDDADPGSASTRRRSRPFHPARRDRPRRRGSSLPAAPQPPSAGPGPSGRGARDHHHLTAARRARPDRRRPLRGGKRLTR